MASRGQDETRACIVGAGRIAEEHVAFLGRSRRVTTVGVADRDELLAERAAAKLNGASVWQDAGAMLAELRPEAVHVLTPAESHLDIAKLALDAGARLVIVEKPATPTLATTQQLIHHAEHHGARVTEDHNYLFNEPTRRLLTLVTSGGLGTVREVSIRMAVPLSRTRYNEPRELARTASRPEGPLSEFLPHLAYLSLAFAPTPIVELVKWAKRDESTRVAPDDLVAVLRPQEKAGPRVVLSFSSESAPATTSLRVHGTIGWAEADLQNPSVRVSRPRDVGDALSPLADQVVGGWQLARDAPRGLLAKLRGSPIYQGIPTFLEATYTAFSDGAALPVSHDDIEGVAKLIETLVEELA